MIKYCVDCENYRKNKGRNYCYKNVVTKLSTVTGRMVLRGTVRRCYEERENYYAGYCTPDAKFFEEKVTFD